MSGHEPEILKLWADVEEGTKGWIAMKWDNAHEPFDQGRKDFFDLTESIANEMNESEWDATIDRLANETMTMKCLQ